MLQTGNSGNRAKSQDSIEVRATRALSHEAAERKARRITRADQELEAYELRRMLDLEMDTFRAFKGVAL